VLARKGLNRLGGWSGVLTAMIFIAAWAVYLICRISTRLVTSMRGSCIATTPAGSRPIRACCPFADWKHERGTLAFVTAAATDATTDLPRPALPN